MKRSRLSSTVLVAGLLLSAPACTAGGDDASSDDAASIREAVSSACFSNYGVRSSQASLAVAMATELKRWNPMVDLASVNGLTGLSQTGEARCSANGGCPRTKALLALQDQSINSVISQHVFSAANWHGELAAGFSRQWAKTEELKRNAPWLLPEDHVLTLIGGPTNLGIGACGPHYLFRATKPGGGLLTRPDNLRYALSFFGLDQGNPFLSFVWNSEWVGVDPIDGDNAAPITSTGSCKTYELDRVYNPTNALLNTCCVTMAGLNGALVPVPRAVGYLGCKAGASPIGGGTSTPTPPAGQEPCTPSATVTGTGSGAFNTTGPYCFRTAATINGWQCSNFTGRSVLVNDQARAVGAMPLPAKHNGYTYFEVSGGSYSWASCSWW